MKKLLIISAVFPPEPVVSAKLSYDIASNISDHFDVIVISPKPTRPFGYKFDLYPMEFDFKHIRANSYTCPYSSFAGRLKESYSFGKYCYKYIRNNKNEINLIYANAWPMMSQYYIVKAAQKFRIPIVIHIQDIYPESLINKLSFGKNLIMALFLPLDKFILKNAGKIIAISEKMKNHLVETRGLNSDKISVIQNWQNEKEFIQYGEMNKTCNKESQLFTFMYLGNIGPVAGVELLIQSFEKAKLKNCRLVIAGSGSMKEYLEKKAKKISDSQIEFWTVPDGKVPEVQSLGDVLMLPIIKGAAMSSIPSKLPAYMFSAKPIIACVEEDSDTADTISLAKCGWIVYPQNIDSLSEMMKIVVSLPSEHLQNLGINGFNYALKNFSKNTNLQNVRSVIDELVK